MQLPLGSSPEFWCCCIQILPLLPAVNMWLKSVGHHHSVMQITSFFGDLCDIFCAFSSAKIPQFWFPGCISQSEPYSSWDRSIQRACCVSGVLGPLGNLLSLKLKVISFLGISLSLYFFLFGEMSFLWTSCYQAQMNQVLWKVFNT